LGDHELTPLMHISHQSVDPRSDVMREASIVSSPHTTHY